MYLIDSPRPASCYYRLVRYVDESGVSGTGIVALAYQLASGEFVTYWRARPHPDPKRHTDASITVHPHLQNAINVHGHQGLSLWEPVPTPDESSVYGEILKIHKSFVDAIEAEKNRN